MSSAAKRDSNQTRNTFYFILCISVFITFSVSGQIDEKGSRLGQDHISERDGRKSLRTCPERYVGDEKTQTEIKCPRNCTNDHDCGNGTKTKCTCFGECGLSCIDKKKAFCKHPGKLENGKVIAVGYSGFYELQYLKEKVRSKGQILFECDPGYALVGEPPEKTCENGKWAPDGFPNCTKTDSPGFNWLRTGRIKRKAIKTGGSSSIVRTKVGGSPGGLGGMRRGSNKKKMNRGDGEEVEIIPEVCENLDYDPYIQIEVIQIGIDPNETFSSGALVKVSCTSGFGVNLPNETIKCDNGKWRPKIPQCSALPCKTPYIDHGTFYEGPKPLYFQELRKHKITAEIRCSRGYKLKGPRTMHCWYGEWDVDEAPECVPAKCTLPELESGSYLQNYEEGNVVGHTESVDYACLGDFKKPRSGPARCEFGEWIPQRPICVGPTVNIADFIKSGKGQPRVKRSCGTPPKEAGAHVFTEGLPLDYTKQFSFQDGMDVVFRCKTINPKEKAKNRWKITCQDGSWIGMSNHSCDGTSPADKWITLPLMKDINGSCVFKRKDVHVVTFHGDQMVIDDNQEFPHGSIVTSRCVDIGKFRIEGAVRRKCLSAGWLGVTPTCSGLSQYNDYATDKPPTILFRYQNGSIVQSNDGRLIVYPGTTLHMECLWIRKFGRPRWEKWRRDKFIRITDETTGNKLYPEGWAEADGRDSQLEWRITIDKITPKDNGLYRCFTPARHFHTIEVLVKEASCNPLPEHPDLVYSSTDTILGTRVSFSCKYNKSLMGITEIFCSSTGVWSASLPKCTYVECPDISILPAMAPLAFSSSAMKNGTLKRNETAPPKISLSGRFVNAKASFNCQQGFVIEGATEAFCLQTGNWSADIPLCKEVECSTPSPPENGVLLTVPPFKAGDLATFECESGYLLEGQAVKVCQDNGKWSKPGNEIKCKVGCPYPSGVIGGTVNNIKFHYDVGETIEFDCQEGYVLKGAQMLHCLKGGKWSSHIPTCTPRNYDHISNYG